jgi:hypothetical protein
MFPGLELYALFITRVMPDAIDKESQRITNRYLEGVQTNQLRMAAVAMAHDPDVFLRGEGAGRSREKI